MTDRPAEFDRRLLSHLPLLQRLAQKYVHPNEREDAVQDAYLYALSAWRKFIPERSFYKWLIWQFRHACTNRKNRHNSYNKCNAAVIGSAQTSTAPQQENIVEARQVINMLTGTRDGDILVKRAMGMGINELAPQYGVKRSRIGQLADQARERITRETA